MIINDLTFFRILQSIRYKAHKRKVERITELSRVKRDNTKHNSLILNGRVYA